MFLLDKYKRGFSLAEIVVVIGIFILFADLGFSVYAGIKNKNNFNVTRNAIVQALRHAQINSEQIQSDSVWGIRILEDRVVIFSGLNYTARDQSHDIDFVFPSPVSFSGLDEYVFNKITGWPIVFGTTTLVYGLETGDIVVNSKGMIKY